MYYGGFAKFSLNLSWFQQQRSVCVCMSVNLKRINCTVLKLCVCLSINVKVQHCILVSMQSMRLIPISQYLLQILVVFRGGSMIPRRRGRQPMILPNFLKNCMKLRNIWTIGERPPGSATGFHGGIGILDLDFRWHLLAGISCTYEHY